MKLFGFTGIMLICFLVNSAYTRPMNYFYREASIGFRNHVGAEVRLHERFSLNGWYGDYYQNLPEKVGLKSSWSGWDFNPGLTVDIVTDGPVQLSAGAHFRVTLRYASYSETRPTIQADLGLPAGPVTFDVRLLLERRYIQDGDYYISDTSYYDRLKRSETRFRPRIKISPTQGLTKANLKPYFFWEGRFQKHQLPLHLMDIPLPDGVYPCYCDDDREWVDFWHGFELGVMSRLSENFGLGLADQIMIIPGTTRTGHHRFSTYLLWYFDFTGND